MESWTPPPELGAHTDEVLAEVLGLSAARLTQLRRDHVIGERQPELVLGGQ